MQPQNDAIVLNEATKKFSDKVVVDHISLSVPRGTIFGVIGPSGSGKTTAIRLILGVHLPDEGSVTVLDQEPRRFSARTRAKVGYLPQHFVLYPELSIRENLNFVASCYGVPLTGRKERIAKNSISLVCRKRRTHSLRTHPVACSGAWDLPAHSFMSPNLSF